MYWKNNSLPAFTLLEMIMVMLLSGILLGIVYFGLNIAQTYYNDYASEKEHLKKVHLVNNLLERDFIFSELVAGEPGSISCVYQTYEVKYTLNEEYIVRTQNFAADTFFLKSNNLKLFFQKEEIVEQSEIIDEIIFQLGEEKYTIHCQKLYASDKLFEKVVNQN